MSGNVVAADKGAATALPNMPAGFFVPAQLPLDVHGFTGRRAALAGLDLLIDDQSGAAPPAVLITAIQGMPGVGKTSLAVHWAHRVAARFPGGQLYLDLGGHSSRGAVTVTDALGHLLRGLGVDGTQIPADEAERAAVYRSAIAGRQVLIVLDNAASAEQIRPLLPGSSSCLVVITSRNQLVGLVAHDGARTINLDVLSTGEAVELFTTILGAERVAAEADAVAELARLCAYLPLAIRVAAADLVARQHDSIESLVRELSGDRLSALTIEEDPRSAVQAAFELSFQRLSDDAKIAFRRLGLIEGPDFTSDAVAALLDLPVGASQRMLRGLARANLIESNRPGRYRLHDLLREYARNLTEHGDNDDQRGEAVRNLLDWYLARSRAAGRVLHPHRRSLGELGPTPQPSAPVSYSDALSWFESERANLIAAIGHAEHVGLDAFTWELADALYDFLDLRSYHVDNINIHQAGLAAAQRHSDALASAYMLQHIALVETHQSRYLDAIDHAQRALSLLRKIGDDSYAESAPLNALARIYLRLGRYPEALQNGKEALRLREKIGDRRGEAETLDNLVSLSWRMCRYADALQEGNRALAIWREVGDRRGESEALINIATVQGSIGNTSQALSIADEALAICRQTADEYGMANALATLSNTYRKLARYAEALEYAEQTLVIRREIGDLRGVAAILVNQGKIYTESGQYAEALRCLRRALTIQRDIGDRPGEGETLCETGYTYWRRGRFPQSLRRLDQALIIQRDVGDRNGEAETLDIMGRIYRRKQDYPAALRFVGTSLRIRREIGDRSGAAESLGSLARIQRRQGRYDRALVNARAALAIYRDVGFRRGVVATLDNIARITRRMGNVRAALVDAQEALRISMEVQHKYDESMCRDGLARIWLELGESVAALDEASIALAIENEIGDLYGVSQTLEVLCSIYEQLGRPHYALDCATRAVVLRRQSGDMHGAASMLAVRERISATLGDDLVDD